MLRHFGGTLTAIVVCALASAPAHAQSEPEHNGGATPLGANDIYGLGWTYTPTIAFTLTSIETRFAVVPTDRTAAFQYGARQITAEVRSSGKGSVLRSVTFTSTNTGDWVGGTFAGLALTAGTSYFINWLNIGQIGNFGEPNSVGRNFLSQAPTGEWTTLESDLNKGFGFNPQTTIFWDPIVRLKGVTTVVPEPTSMTLLAAGLIGLAGAAIRRRKLQA